MPLRVRHTYVKTRNISMHKYIKIPKYRNILYFSLLERIKTANVNSFKEKNTVT